jgi:glucan 1,3-beta-glucosidase
MQDDKWRGVNLGGWLVLEKWMTPSLFDGLRAVDEYGFCDELGLDAENRLKTHRDMFITETDFVWLAEHGINTIRLPIGYWLFGDEPPYIGTVEYVDRAFDWAEKHGIGILLDLHGAPGGQNGYKHSGREGVMAWGKPENIQKSVEVIERLAKRYGQRPGLVAIELMNEPSWQLGRRKIHRFYHMVYRTLRAHCHSDVMVVFSDAYRPRRWRFTLPKWRYKNVGLDVHLYQVYKPGDKQRDLFDHVSKASGWRRLLRSLSRQRAVIVGEWSLAIGSQALAGKTQAETKAARQAYGLAQLRAFQPAKGWFYWNYKTESGGPWSYRSCVEQGWLPPSYDEHGL